MLTLTRMNGEKFTVNATMVELVESTPDTMITLVSGRKLTVLEPARNVIEGVTEYYRSIGLFAVWPPQWKEAADHES